MLNSYQSFHSCCIISTISVVAFTSVSSCIPFHPSNSHVSFHSFQSFHSCTNFIIPLHAIPCYFMSFAHCIDSILKLIFPYSNSCLGSYSFSLHLFHSFVEFNEISLNLISSHVQFRVTCTWMSFHVHLFSIRSPVSLICTWHPFPFFSSQFISSHYVPCMPANVTPSSKFKSIVYSFDH